MDFLPHIGDRLAGTDGGKKLFFEIVQSMADKNSSVVFFIFIQVAKKTTDLFFKFNVSVREAHPNQKRRGGIS